MDSKVNKNLTPIAENKITSNYTGAQTPIERLRNKLTPFLILAEVLDRDKEFDTSTLIKTCSLYKNDIHSYLSDCEVFYAKKEVDGFPVRKVCFFKIENEKYIAENGMEITGEMLVKYSHHIGFPYNYIVLE